MLTHKTFKIKKIIKENPRVRTFVLDGALEAAPGQFVMVWVPGVDEKPMSLANVDPIELAVANVGPCSEAMHKLKVGDKLSIRGPYGNSYHLKGKRILLVAGGYGVAPLTFLAKVARKKKIEVWAVIGAKTKSELLYEKRLKKVAKKVLITTDDGSAGLKGLVTDGVKRALKSAKFDCVYTCGPELMMKATGWLAKKSNIPCELSIERNMKCAFGICGECDVSGWMACYDGTICEYETAKKLEDFGSTKRALSGKKVGLHERD